MSTARMTYSVIIPALIAMLVPTLSMVFSQYLTSRSVLNFVLIVSVLLIVLYAVGMVSLALRDHEHISDKRALAHRRSK